VATPSDSYEQAYSQTATATLSGFVGSNGQNALTASQLSYAKQALTYALDHNVQNPNNIGLTGKVPNAQVIADLTTTINLGVPQYSTMQAVVNQINAVKTPNATQKAIRNRFASAIAVNQEIVTSVMRGNAVASVSTALSANEVANITTGELAVGTVALTAVTGNAAIAGTITAGIADTATVATLPQSSSVVEALPETTATQKAVTSAVAKPKMSITEIIIGVLIVIGLFVFAVFSFGAEK
jgi:hypothetical protein